MEEMKLNTGAVESPRDYRDIPLAAVQAPVALPNWYLSGAEKLPIFYQGKIGACVGHAWAKVKQWAELQETGKVIAFSPRFIYSLCKKNDGLTMEGTYPRLGGQILQGDGCATELTLPNDVSIGNEAYIDPKAISAAAFEEATPFAIKGYAAVGLDVDSLKQAIYQNGAIVLILKVGSEWWTARDGAVSWNENDILPLRPPKTIVSGHAVALVGYSVFGDDTMFYFVNSWSDRWGKAGMGSFRFSEYKNFLTEAWAHVELPNDLILDAKALPRPADFKHQFGTDLAYGLEDEEVKWLQYTLKMEGLFPIATPASGFYGAITRKAVLAFQKKYNITTAVENLLWGGKYCGSRTRKKLNALYGW